jgi:hypothetical protein
MAVDCGRQNRKPPARGAGRASSGGTVTTAPAGASGKFTGTGPVAYHTFPQAVEREKRAPSPAKTCGGAGVTRFLAAAILVATPPHRVPLVFVRGVPAGGDFVVAGLAPR